jgi:hypothetical protein
MNTLINTDSASQNKGSTTDIIQDTNMNSSSPSLLSDASSRAVNFSAPNKAEPHELICKFQRSSTRPARSRSSNSPSKPPQTRKVESLVCNTGSRHGWLYNQKYERATGEGGEIQQ